MVEMTAKELAEYQAYLERQEQHKNENYIESLSNSDLINELIRRSYDQPTRYYRDDPQRGYTINSMTGYVMLGSFPVRFCFESDAKGNLY